MAKKEKGASCCGPIQGGMSRCKVESMISVDERGQMVLPKELRDRAGIGAGDKLAVTTWERNGDICCITLVKVEALAEMVKAMLGPVMKEVIEK